MSTHERLEQALHRISEHRQQAVQKLHEARDRKGSNEASDPAIEGIKAELSKLHNAYIRVKQKEESAEILDADRLKGAVMAVSNPANIAKTSLSPVQVAKQNNATASQFTLTT